MTEDDDLRRLAFLVRHDHHTAAFAVGYLAGKVAPDVLGDLLAACEEMRVSMYPVSHLEAYRERYGRAPH